MEYTPKIIDCFTFYNEMNLLTYRLNILNDVVDWFIIVESKYTHSGIEKPLFFNDNKHLFSNFIHKIIHIILKDAPFIYPNINYEQNEQWSNEFYQRDMIHYGIDKLTLHSTDVITITDLDEIPDPRTLTQLKKLPISVITLGMKMYYYNLNTVLLNLDSPDNIWWPKAKLISYKTYKLYKLSCSNIRHLNCQLFTNGGWHLSYFGNASFIQNKLKMFAHQEYNKEEYTNLTQVNRVIETGGDLFNRTNEGITKISIKNNNYLPPKYDIYLQEFIQDVPDTPPDKTKE
jgi:beta-1,4-mannosyl-glycoprotein beta-1,4-N-acetylglucosaminyltransferase